MRQVAEALRINATETQQLMNSKSEFGSNSVPRITVDNEANSNNFKRVQYDPPTEMNATKRRKTQRNTTQNAFQAANPTLVNEPPPSFNQIISKFCIKNASRRMHPNENAPEMAQQCLVNAANSNMPKENAPSMFQNDKDRKRERPPDRN